METITELRFPAIAYQQGPDRTLYTFTAPGSELSRFTTVSRIRRDDKTNVEGYQRPEVLSHIAEIRDYLRSDDAMLPNAVVIAFDDRVRFDAHPASGGSGQFGEIVVPIDEDLPDHEKPGWMVDGQQRMAALKAADLDQFNVCAVGFIAENDEEQREQFILVNSTKPLPRSLIYELLPVTDCRLPAFLKRRQFPARLLERLNYDEDSPLYHRVRTPTNPGGVIKDNSVLKMIENSLSEGALYRYRDPVTGDHDADAMLNLLKTYWAAVAEVFPRAWAEPPRKSRLTHGAGIVSMGYVMDAIVDRHRRREGKPSKEIFISDLEPLVTVCRWTDGFWEFGPGAQRRWDEIQNTSKDIQILTNYLMVQYKTLVWNQSLHRSTAGRK
jgi:DGQHR domain-containing protein